MWSFNLLVYNLLYAGMTHTGNIPALTTDKRRNSVLKCCVLDGDCTILISLAGKAESARLFGWCGDDEKGRNRSFSNGLNLRNYGSVSSVSLQPGSDRRSCYTLNTTLGDGAQSGAVVMAAYLFSSADPLNLVETVTLPYRPSPPGSIWSSAWLAHDSAVVGASAGMDTMVLRVDSDRLVPQHATKATSDVFDVWPWLGSSEVVSLGMRNGSVALWDTRSHSAAAVVARCAASIVAVRPLGGDDHCSSPYVLVADAGECGEIRDGRQLGRGAVHALPGYNNSAKRYGVCVDGAMGGITTSCGADTRLRSWDSRGAPIFVGEASSGEADRPWGVAVAPTTTRGWSPTRLFVAGERHVAAWGRPLSAMDSDGDGV